MKELTMVKLGGSLITQKGVPFTENPAVIKRLGRELKQAQEETGVALVVGHGGGSYPHVPAVKYRTAEGILGEESLTGIAQVQDAASRLDRIVVAAFIDLGLRAVSISPSSCMVSKKGEVSRVFLPPIKMLLEKGLIPVVYGDVVMDKEKGCAILSTERVLRSIAVGLTGEYKVTKVAHCGNTDGVYNPKGETISELNSGQFKLVKGHIRGSAGIDVTGGMLHKVEESLLLAKRGIPCVIFNGEREGELLNVLRDKPHRGTEVVWK